MLKRLVKKLRRAELLLSLGAGLGAGRVYLWLQAAEFPGETGGEELLTREKPSEPLVRLTASTVSHGDCAFTM